MLKKVIFALFILLHTTVFAESSYDRTIEVLDSSRDEKVKQVFRELIGAYQDEDARTFFDFVSEDRFLQDYITFSDGIYQDFRLYDILQVDYWFDQVVPKGVKRFVFVRWEKQLESLESSEQLTQKGYSRFLFDEIDGQYLLIEVAGNHLWAGSMQEWRSEVPAISGQEVDEQPAALLPDLSVTIASHAPTAFNINNIGTQDVSEDVPWQIVENGALQESGVYSGGISAGSSARIDTKFYSSQQPYTIEILFSDSDSANNTVEIAF